jgi:hypothetical protein
MRAFHQSQRCGRAGGDLKSDQREVKRRFAKPNHRAKIPMEVVDSADAQKARALARYREVGTVRGACHAAGIGRRTWYNWLEEDRRFASLVQEARDDVADELEEEASRRAKAQNGSDKLLIFLLKALRPSKYRENVKVDMVSPIVREKVRQTVSIIRTELDAPAAARVLNRLNEVWR